MGDEMLPKIRRRDKKLHASYQVSHRIHCSAIYPLPAPNGSTLLLYGYDNGIRVLWKGGRRLRNVSPPAAARQPNGTGTSQDVMVIDDDEEEDAETQQTQGGDAYEPEEDGRESGDSSPQLVQDVHIEFGTAVLQMALPSPPATITSQLPQLTKTHAILAVACANSNILLLAIPLAPPRSSSIPDFVSKSVLETKLSTDGILANDICIKIIPNNDTDADQSKPRQRRASGTDESHEARLLVAADIKRLQLWSVDLTSTSMSTAKKLPNPVLHSPSSGSKISFHPSARSAELLFAELSGALRIYEPFAISASNERSNPSSQHAGRWIMSYFTPFHSQPNQPSFPRQKRILGAEWVLGGRGILALLEDGQWGIWDLTGSTQPGKAVEDFAIHGFLVSSTPAEPVDTSTRKKTSSKLAPMTPNTRKSKADNLFSGPPKAPGVASTGGISVSRSVSRSGTADESVIIWYNGAIYSIASLQSFWQKSNNKKTGGLGSLYAPALTHISDIDLMDELITSISQFPVPPPSASTARGNPNLPRDLLVSAEHRFNLIIQPSSSSGTALFQPHVLERPPIHDQLMLDAGELDLGGMDRMLDNMVGESGSGERRQVGFAH